MIRRALENSELVVVANAEGLESSGVSNDPNSVMHETRHIHSRALNKLNYFCATLCNRELYEDRVSFLSLDETSYETA